MKTAKFMRTPMLRSLVVCLGLGLAGACHAAGNGIYQREAEGGAVELSNLMGEDEGKLLVAPSAAEAAVPAPRSASVNGQPPATARRTAARDKRKDDPAAEEDTESSAAAAEADARYLESGEPRPQAASANDAWAGAGAQPGMSGYGTGSFMAGSAPRAAAGTGATAGTAPAPVTADSSTGDAASGSGQTPTNQSTAAAGTGSSSTPTSSVLDSPTALAARLAQYRDLMVNSPLGANGLPSNPAVVRRYRMVSRSGYMSAGW